MVFLHVASALIALSAGLAVLCLTKGTALHRGLGRAYAASIVLMCVSSFGIYRLLDGPSIFHAVSVATLAVVLAGLTQPWFRRSRDNWLRWHLLLMQTSYLMLVVTGISQFFDRLPFDSAALNAIVFLQIPCILGVVLIVRADRRRLRYAA